MLVGHPIVSLFSASVFLIVCLKSLFVGVFIVCVSLVCLCRCFCLMVLVSVVFVKVYLLVYLYCL